MNFNQATDYAFRSVLFLANQPKGKMVEAQLIAKQEVIPMRFLLKIMPSLTKAGIVKSQRGVGGGYYLAKEAEDISFYDVVTAIEGSIAINRCLREPDACNKRATDYCRVHQALAGIQETLVKELKSHNFGELL